MRSKTGARQRAVRVHLPKPRDVQQRKRSGRGHRKPSRASKPSKVSAKSVTSAPVSGVGGRRHLTTVPGLINAVPVIPGCRIQRVAPYTDVPRAAQVPLALWFEAKEAEPLSVHLAATDVTLDAEMTKSRSLIGAGHAYVAPPGGKAIGKPESLSVPEPTHPANRFGATLLACGAAICAAIAFGDMLLTISTAPGPVGSSALPRTSISAEARTWADRAPHKVGSIQPSNQGRQVIPVMQIADLATNSTPEVELPEQATLHAPADQASTIKAPSISTTIAATGPYIPRSQPETAARIPAKTVAAVAVPAIGNPPASPARLLIPTRRPLATTNVSSARITTPIRAAVARGPTRPAVVVSSRVVSTQARPVNLSALGLAPTD